MLKQAAIGVATVVLAFLAGDPTKAGAVLDKIKANSNLRWGVGGSIPTFSRVDSKGEWTGLDVDSKYSQRLEAKLNAHRSR